MHVYTWLAHLDIRIDQNTPFLNKRLKKFSGEDPTPSEEGDTPSPHPTRSALELGASCPPPPTKCLDQPLRLQIHNAFTNDY